MRPLEELLDNKGWNATWNVDRELSGMIKFTPGSVKIIHDMIAKSREDAARLLALADKCEKIMGERS